MNERIKEIDKFLKQVAKLYIDNPDLIINENTIYDFLVSNGKEKNTIKPYYEGWIEYFKNVLNINVQKWDNGCFCEFENLGLDREYADYVKLYIPVSSKNIDKIVKDLFTYLSSRNIYHQSKIGSSERYDDIVIRLENPSDIKIIEEYVKNNPDIKESSIGRIPFNFTSEYISYAMDGHTSYNSLVCSYIKSYLENKKRNGLLNLKSISYADFKEYSTLIYENCFGKNYTRENYNWFISTFECARYVLRESFDVQFHDLSNCSNIFINALNTNDLNVFYDIVKKNQKNAINVRDVVKSCFDEMVKNEGVEKAKINFEQYIRTHNENYIPSSYRDAIKIIYMSAIKTEYDSIKGNYNIKGNYEIVKECFNYMLNKYKSEGYIGFFNRVNTYISTGNINLFSTEYRNDIQRMGKEELVKNFNKVRDEYVKNNNINNTNEKSSNIINDLYKSLINRVKTLGSKCKIVNQNDKIEIYVGDKYMSLMVYNNELLFNLNNGDSENTIGYDINTTNIDIVLSRCVNIISNEKNDTYEIIKSSFYCMLDKYNSYDLVLAQFNSCIANNDFNYISREYRKALEIIGVDKLKKNLDIITKEYLNKEKFNNKDISIDVTSTLVESVDTTIKKLNSNLDDKTLKYLRVSAIKEIMPDLLNNNYNKIIKELNAKSNLEVIGSNAISIDLIKACIINKASNFKYKSNFSKEEIDNEISKVLYQVEDGNIDNMLLLLKNPKTQQILVENYAYTSSYTTKEQRDIIYNSSNIKNKDLLVSTQNEYILNNQKTY